MSKIMWQVFSALCLVLFTSFTVADQCEIGSGRAQIYISDTHAGFGGLCENPEFCSNGWHNMEDFRWHGDFKLFIQHIVNSLDQPIDLIVVGDFLELWQDPNEQFPCGIPGKQRSNLGCSSDQAKARIKQIGLDHRALFDVLSMFVSEEENQIILLPGNHDAALVMESVANETKKQFSAEAQDRICVDEDGMLLVNSDRYTVFIEHGHQLEGDVNSYDKPLNGVVECIFENGEPANCNKAGAFVRRSWGENFVQNYYNQYEKLFPVIDNYSVEGSGLPDGVERGLKASVPSGRKSALLRFVTFFFAKQTAKQLGGFMGGPDEPITSFCEEKINDDPCIDLDRMMDFSVNHPIFTALPAGQRELLTLVFTVPEKANPLLSDVYELHGANHEELNQLLVTTCVYWSKDTEDSSPNCLYQNRSMGALKENVAHWFKGLIDKDYEKLAGHILDREGQFRQKFTHFVYGHTHQADSRESPKDRTVILNTGAWQRVASPRVMADLITDCTQTGHKTDDECFREMTPEDLPACYSLVAAVSNLGPKLYWWAKEVEDADHEFKLFMNGKQPIHCYQ